MNPRTDVSSDADSPDTDLAGTASAPTRASGMATRSFKVRVSLAVLLIVVVVAALIFPFPMQGRLWGEIFDLAHAPVFLITLLLTVALIDPSAVGWPHAGPPLVRLHFGRILALTIALMVLGMVAEFLQQFAGRHSNWSDVVANCAGLLAGLCWLAAHSETAAKRIALKWTGVGLLLLVTVPSALDAWGCVRQVQQFPLLASFENQRELKSWSAFNSELQVDPTWATDGRSSLRMRLQPGDYAGTAMIWFETNWQPHQSLRVDVRNPNSFPLTVVVKIFDGRHTTSGFRTEDRFHRLLQLPPNSEQHVRISLADVASGPATRSLDLHDVRGLEFFCGDLTQPATLQLDNLRLTD